MTSRLSTLAEDCAKAVAACASAPDDSLALTVRGYGSCQRRSTAANQFLIIIKPELASPNKGGRAEAVIELVLTALDDHAVEVHGTRVLSTAHVARHRLIEDHYAVLHRVSKRGFAALPTSARTELARLAFCVPADHLVGGHEFLAANPFVSAAALDLLARNLEVTKLAAGVYATRLEIDNESWLILNAFHPYQLEHFQRPGRALILLECLSGRDLREVREQVIGATDPVDATAGSLKRVIFEQQEELGVGPISIRLNGIHASPGPVEAMFGIQRYFGEQDPLHIDQLLFGRLLLAEGHDEAAVAALASNPEVEIDGRHAPLFELTENSNWDSAFSLVDRLLRRESSDA